MTDGKTTKPPSFVPSPLLEREWNRLLTMVGEKRVIPIIGPELLCIPWQGKPLARLYDVWGQALAQQLGIDGGQPAEETPLLYRIANQLSVDPNLPYGGLESLVNEVVCERRWPLPEPMRQLAAIRDFSLLVTTTVDHLLEAALAEGRAQEEPSSIIFRRGGDEESNDLPRDFIPGARPTVFHLFGATCVDRDSFAATEDTLIDFSWALIDQDYAPKRLYDFLRGKTLLLLGCDFPDWLARFLIHALTRRPDARIEVWFVSESRQGGLRDYLRRQRFNVPSPQSPVSFVAELHRRWQQRQELHPREGATRSPAPESKPGAVFISYSRENQAAANVIRAQLEEAGIDTWMDETGLEPGAEFQQVIRDNIGRASFFLAVISRALDLEASGRPGRFVLREWKWAESTNEERSKDHCFLQPVVVDDTPAGAHFVDPPFRSLEWTRLQGGKLPRSFVVFLKKGIRRFRSSRVGATR